MINPVVDFAPMRSINLMKLVQNSLRGKKRRAPRDQEIRREERKGYFLACRGRIRERRGAKEQVKELDILYWKGGLDEV